MSELTPKATVSQPPNYPPDSLEARAQAGFDCGMTVIQDLQRRKGLVTFDFQFKPPADTDFIAQTVCIGLLDRDRDCPSNLSWVLPRYDGSQLWISSQAHIDNVLALNPKIHWTEYTVTLRRRDPVTKRLAKEPASPEDIIWGGLVMQQAGDECLRQLREASAVPIGRIARRRRWLHPLHHETS